MYHTTQTMQHTHFKKWYCTGLHKAIPSKYIMYFGYISLIPHYANPSLPTPRFALKLIAFLCFYFIQSSNTTFAIQIVAF